MRLGSHLQDTIHKDLGAALREEAQDIRDELLTGAIGMDANAERLHALRDLRRG